MAKMKVLTLERLREFVTECKALFASRTAVAANDRDIETYVLNIDYENNLAFDTSEIV